MDAACINFFRRHGSSDKKLAENSAAVQALYSSVTSLVVLAPLTLRTPRRVLATRRPGLMVARAGFSAGGVVLYYFSFHQLPLADANAIAFTRSLWIAPLAALLLHERISASCWVGLGIGFGGILLMVAPAGSHGASWAYVAGVASALLLAMGVTGIKALTREHGTLTSLSWSAILGTLLMIPPALFEWRSPNVADAFWLVALGLLSVITQAAYVRGMAIGEAAPMAVVDYSRIIFAVLSGYLFFGDVPGWLTYIGIAAIIVATALALVKRPRRAATVEATVL